MSPSLAASTLGRLGAQRKRQIEREPIRAKARAMRAAFGMEPAAALIPELILTQADRL